MVNNLLESLKTILLSRHCCVAYSGGLDSHVLLHVMSELQQQHPEFQCRAMHINHGLHPHADVWEAHCQQTCLDVGIDFIAYKVQLDIQPGDSVEAVAREARYKKFSELLLSEECLLTAHTRNDQAETLLLQLLRGAGVKGLAAMPAKKSFAPGYLLRPFLKMTRDTLYEYAKKNGLVWIEDDSNLELRFDRNYVRHHIIPALQQRWPNLLTTLTRSADHCAETAELIDELADQDLQSIQGDRKTALRLEPFFQLSPARQRNALRRWISWNGYQVPSTKQLEHIFKNVLQASEDAVPEMRCGQAEIRRFRQQLFLVSPLPHPDNTQRVFWDLHSPLTLPYDLGKLMMYKVKGIGLSAELDATKINVRFRCGGERFCPAGREGTQSLKKLFQEWNIPPWQRDCIPLIYYADELIAVVGYGINKNYLVGKDQMGMDIRWLCAMEAANAGDMK